MATTRLELIQRNENTVVVPDTFYYPTPVGGRFIYQVQEGGIFREIIISCKLDAALFLKKHNLIHTYVAFKNGDVKMFRLDDLACDKRNNIFWHSQKEVHWTDFEFTRCQVITFAAINELELLEKESGLVIRMFNKYNRAA